MIFSLDRVIIIDAHDWVPRADSFYDKTRGGWGGQKPHTGPALCSSISHIVLKHLVIFSLSSEYTGTKTLRWNSRMPQMSQQEPSVPITEKSHWRQRKEFIFHLFHIQLQGYLTLGTYCLTAVLVERG